MPARECYLVQTDIPREADEWLRPEDYNTRYLRIDGDADSLVKGQTQATQWNTKEEAEAARAAAEEKYGGAAEFKVVTCLEPAGESVPEDTAEQKVALEKLLDDAQE